MAIIGDLEQFQTTVLDYYFQRSRTSVNGIFNQFFECMHWSDNDLSCGNLVDDILVKSLLQDHHECFVVVSGQDGVSP